MTNPTNDQDRLAAERAARAARIDHCYVQGKQNNTGKIVAGGLAALALVGGAFFAINRGQAANPGTASTPGSNGLPKGVEKLGDGIVLNAAAAKAGAPTLDIYEDFQCPICKQVHGLLAPTVNKLAESGDAKVVVHMMSFLDAKTGATYSVPVANAFACATDLGKGRAFHDAALELQASEGTSLTPDLLNQMASKAGFAGNDLSTFTTCAKSDKYTAYTKSVDDTASRANVTGTPTYRVNGTDVKFTSAQTAVDELTKALAAAKK